MVSDKIDLSMIFVDTASYACFQKQSIVGIEKDTDYLRICRNRIDQITTPAPNNIKDGI